MATADGGGKSPSKVHISAYLGTPYFVVGGILVHHIGRSASRNSTNHTAGLILRPGQWRWRQWLAPLLAKNNSEPCRHRRSSRELRLNICIRRIMHHASSKANSCHHLSHALSSLKYASGLSRTQAYSSRRAEDTTMVIDQQWLHIYIESATPSSQLRASYWSRL